MTAPDWDAVVVGGGPAGAVAALRLAPRARVLLLEQTSQDRPRIGESLPPAARPLLRDLGLLDLVAGHRAYLGNHVRWGAPGPATHDFLLDPQGAGWHLDRGRFDGDLRRRAEAADAAVRRGSRITGLTRGSNGWRLTVAGVSGVESPTAHILIDASGRAAAAARRAGASRRIDDRLTGLYTVLPDPVGGDAFSRIAAVREGWWYTAPAGADRRVVAFHTDSDRPVLRRLRDPAGFREALGEVPMVAAAVGEGELPADVHVVAAHGAETVPAAGPDWLAVGDAATGLDPLSSQGLMNALFTGMAGGDAALAALGGEPDTLSTYAGRVADVYAAYRRNAAHFYAAEAWRHDDAFWARRRH